MAVLGFDVLARRYRSVYAGFVSWDVTLADMLADPYERDTVELLAAELREHGRFRQPVRLGVYEDWEWSGTPGEERLVGVFDAVLDGTHRVCAHLLTGVQDVFVVFEGEDTGFVGGFTGDESDPTYDLIMTTYIDAPLPLSGWAPERVLALAGADEREADLDMWEVLMSLRVDDGVWVTSATAGSQRHDGVLAVSVTWDAEAFHVLPEVLSERVVGKLARFGYDTGVLRVRTVLEDMAEDVPRVVDARLVLPELTVFV